MFQLSGNYLEIKSPVTVNGIIPKIENGKVIYKITYAPLKARKKFEKLYSKFPETLRPILRNVTVDEIPEDYLPELLKLQQASQQDNEPEDDGLLGNDSGEVATKTQSKKSK